MSLSSGGKKGKLPTIGSLGACFSSGGAVDVPVKGHADADDDEAAAVDLERARITCRGAYRRPMRLKAIVFGGNGWIDDRSQSQRSRDGTGENNLAALE